MRRILDAVCAEYGVSPEDVLGKSRLQNIAQARHVLQALLFESGLSNRRVARVTGKNFDSVRHARKKVSAQEEYDGRERARIARVRESLKMPRRGGEPVWVVTMSDSKGHAVMGVYHDEEEARGMRPTWGKGHVWRSVLA